jgi:hypothetical protein
VSNSAGNTAACMLSYAHLWGRLSCGVTLGRFCDKREMFALDGCREKTDIFDPSSCIQITNQVLSIEHVLVEHHGLDGCRECILVSYKSSWQCYCVTERDMKWPHVHQHVVAPNPPNYVEAFVALWSGKQKQRPTNFFFCFFIHFIRYNFIISSLSMKINLVSHGTHTCYVEVSPSDTIWTLKGKLHREAALRRPSESTEGEGSIPPPDDQKLYLLPHYEELSQCDKTMEFYHLHEGSRVRCELKWSEYVYPQEMHFRECLNVFRKVERNALSSKREFGEITSSMIVWVKHACCHLHEVRVLSLMYDEIGDKGAIRIAEVLERNTSLKELHLRGVFPLHLSFVCCCISYSFIF